MRHLIIFSLLGLSFAACNQSSTPVGANEVHPFIGCWETENGLEREGWTIDPSGWLIGYAASRDTDGNVTFFEHMRIERSKDPEMLVVTGRDGSETRFARRIGDDTSEYRFENPEHDYPQVIVYKRNGDVLNAYIDLMAGGKKVIFDKMACRGN